MRSHLALSTTLLLLLAFALISPFSNVSAEKGPDHLLSVARSAFKAGASANEAIVAAARAAGRNVVRQDTLGGEGYFVNPMVKENQASVILIHGLGGSGEEWGFISLMISYLTLTYVRFVLPTAPERRITYLDTEMNSWFDMVFNDKRRFNWDVIDEFVMCDAEQMDASVARIERLIEEEVNVGIKPDRIFLLGFSQGGGLATNAFLKTKYRLAGFMGIATWFPFQQSFPTVDASRKNKGAEMFFQHGLKDTAVDPRWFESSTARLTEMGFKVTNRTYPEGVHALVNKDVILDVEAFIMRLAPGQSRFMQTTIERLTLQFSEASRDLELITPATLRS
eukprot:Plantae.Rhodophyta-Palmaria_palmata.ctg2479.p1 GENE.Plantae.Rhodophyta-Palmaria_palmata.ctg2479~~Plantae.Rhodophyta-Palmaria_palmata.ctg2479.p1  ORF type:complete len:337 (+),score=35.30 Plantae.Rhodophyta-Palmaria_palmata.ctg2479:151-1161(+)